MLTSYVELVMIYIGLSYIVSAKVCKHRDPNALTSVSSGDAVTSISPLSSKLKENIETPHRSKCCPYDFDSRKCSVVDDKILCGFNKNVGGHKSLGDTVNLNNGCRMRGGRLECGYVQGPFENSRRPPPVWEHSVNDNDFLDNDISKEVTDKALLNENLKNRFQEHPQKGTRCLEVRDSIVCRDFV